MKITRAVAAFLCLMRAMTSLPMIASAEVSDPLFNTIGVLTARTSSSAVENHEILYGMNLDFIDNFSQTEYEDDTTQVVPDEYNSLEEIVDGPVAATYVFNFTEDFNPNMYVTENNKPAGVFSSDNSAITTADGLKFVNWKFFPTAYWSAFKGRNDENTFVTFKAKTDANFVVQGNEPGNAGRFYVNIEATKSINPSCDSGTTIETHNSITPGIDWAEYMLMSNDEGGFSAYMKNKETGEKWKHIFSTHGYESGTYMFTGISFYDPDGNGTYLKDLKIYTYSQGKSLFDNAAKSAGVTQLMYSDDFSTTPAYSKIDGTGLSYVDGKMVLSENAANEAQVFWLNTEIPKGGYAEYRMNVGETNPTVTFYDGNTSFSVYHCINYGTVYYDDVTTLYAGGGNSTYQTWRVVREKNGNYSLYCRADGESNWYAVVTDVAGKTASNTKNICFSGTTNYAGEEGVVKIDYMKIYGPASDQDVILTDGSNIITGNEQPLMLDSIFASIKPDLAKDRVFFFAVYGANGNLIDIIREDIPAGNESTTIHCNALRESDEIQKVKAFLWDGLRGIVPVMEAIEMKGNVVAREDD